MIRLLSTAVLEGGWAMWAILACGLAGVGVAGLFAWRRERLLLGPVRWITVALLASGCFGFFIDLQAVFQYSTVGLDSVHPVQGGVSSDRRTYIVLQGINESLNCLSSASLFTILIALLVAMGCWRSGVAHEDA